MPPFVMHTRSPSPYEIAPYLNVPAHKARHYTHQKLHADLGKAFRLFKLYPGPPDADLAGEILIRRIHVVQSQSRGPLPDAEPYEALSYCWGPFQDGIPPLKIVENDRASQVYIRPNLTSALKSLRRPHEYRMLWVDALCINQQDTNEKNRQISYISSIYNNAEHVRVWLGPEDKTSAMAMKFIGNVHNLNVFEKMVEDPNASQEWDALSSLMRRPWFSRRWIIQEIAMAKHATLHCGSEEVLWRHFVDVVSQLSYKRDELRQLFRQSPKFDHPTDYLGDLSDLGAIRLVNTSDDLVHKSRDGKMIGLNFSLEALISSMSAFKAEFAHDTVYAILWLANDAHPLPQTSKTVSAPSTPAISGVISPTPSTYLSYAATPPASSGAEYQPSSPGESYSMHSGSANTLMEPPSPKRDSVHAFGVVPTIKEPHSNPFDSFSFTSPEEVQGKEPFPDLNSSSLSLDTALSDPADDHKHLTKLSVYWALGSRRLSITNIHDDLRKKKRAVQMFRDGIRRGRFPVSYDKPIFEVCKDLLVFIINRSKSLDILCRPWAPDDKANPMPTWVCSLANRGPFSASHTVHGVNSHGVQRRRRADPLLGKVEPGGPPYRASSAIPADWKFPENRPRILQATGFRIDSCPVQARNIMPEARAGAVPVEWRHAIGWNNIDMAPPDCFWRTLVANRNGFGRRPPSYWAQACQHAFSDWHDSDLETTTVLQQGRVSAAVREYLERVQGVIWLRKLVLLPQVDEDPILCLAPLEIQDGDIIVVLYGCSVPVVLRPKPVDPSGIALPDAEPHFEYELVGECYVDGMMDGEAHGIRTRSKSKDDKLNERFDLR